MFKIFVKYSQTLVNINKTVSKTYTYITLTKISIYCYIVSHCEMQNYECINKY